MLLGTTIISAQEEWIDIEIEKANRLIETEAYNQAVRILEQALIKAERLYGTEHASCGFIVSELAYAYLLNDEVEKAASLFEKIIARYETAGGPADPRIGEAYLELANIYDADGQSQKALKVYQKAVSSLKQHLAADDPFLLDLSSYLAELKNSQEIPEPDQDTIVIREKSLPAKKNTREEIRSQQIETGQINKPLIPQQQPQQQKTDAPESTEGFTIRAVECPPTFNITSGGGKPQLPSMTVTYSLNTTQDQTEWDQVFEVIGPDGEIGDAGGGRQWYSASLHSGSKIYTVKGYSLLKKPGMYKFRLTLKGDHLTPVSIEREFELH